MKSLRSGSLVARATLLFALIVGLVVGGLGAYLHREASAALMVRADYALLGRVAHFRTLLQDLYTVDQLETHPAVFETMLGNEQDVIIFRKPGAAPFIDVNPEKLALPPITPVPIGTPIGPAAVYKGAPPLNGIPVDWVAVQARVGAHGETVEIIAAHVMTQEHQILSGYSRRAALMVVLAVLAAALLGAAVLARGLRPIRAMADQAAKITPANLATRLNEAQAPLELRHLAAAFNAMLDRLADGYERLSQFSADLAHEIRTPIGALIGQTEVALARTREADEYRTVLEANLEELDRLSRMSENILFLAHADHAGLTVEYASITAGDELAIIANYFEGMADERQLRFNVDAQGTLYANPMMCRRAISNLIVNSVRYATPGTTIFLSGREHANGTTITVENQGPVLPESTLARLFDRFYRGDAARSEFTESNGLGLAIVKAIMTVHGGRAAVCCDAGGRIRFTLEFPPPPRAAV